MESVHAKSYSNIFSTLCSPPRSTGLPLVGGEPETAAQGADRDEFYKVTTAQRKVASTLLESFLFYPASTCRCTGPRGPSSPTPPT
jgi:ribonucleoside-diphosphate reductase beta chain